jgi:CBS domain-containing protein
MKRHEYSSDDAMLAKLESTVDAAHLARPLSVSEIMKKNLITCRPTDTVNRSAQIMWEEGCRCVPVVGDNGRPISIITDRDICMAAYIQGRPLSEIPVSSAMSKRQFVVNAIDTVSEAEAAMRRHGVRRLLVVDEDGMLVGLLSFAHILKHTDACPSASRDPLSPQNIAGTARALRHACTRG